MSRRIWAPWRMAYVEAPKPAGSGCVLCRYVEASLSAETGVLVRWPRSYVVLNKYPYAAGHLMVVPNEHVADLAKVGAEAYGELFLLVRAASACLVEATGAEGMNVGVNIGAAAGAGIEQHVHVHLVPRWVGDHNFMPVFGDVRVLPEYLETTWQRLSPFFERIGNGGAP